MPARTQFAPSPSHARSPRLVFAGTSSACETAMRPITCLFGVHTLPMCTGANHTAKPKLQSPRCTLFLARHLIPRPRQNADGFMRLQRCGRQLTLLPAPSRSPPDHHRIGHLATASSLIPQRNNRHTKQRPTLSSRSAPTPSAHLQSAHTSRVHRGHTTSDTHPVHTPVRTLLPVP